VNAVPAEPVAPTRQLADYLQVLRRRWKLVAAITLLVLGAALAVSLTSTKKYDATAKLLLQTNDRIQTLLNPNASNPPSFDPERDLNTNVELIKLETVADRVRQQLRLNRSTSELLSQVKTETEGTSDVVSITVRDSNPTLAARIANAFAEQYVAFRRRSARTAFSDAAQLARSQLNALPPAARDSEQGRQLQARLRELEISAALQTGGVEIVRRASRPDSPSRPRPLLSAALGLALGLLLGIAAAFVFEFLDRRLKDEEAVEAVFQLPVLATIPRFARRAAERDDRAQREAYGMLAANLRFSGLRGDSGTVMITSPTPAEGKTSVTLGLARALATIGQRVIAIEADLRRPAFSRYVHSPDAGGLTAVLEGQSKLSDDLIWLDANTVEPVTLDGVKDGVSFAVLPAGPRPANPQRALARPAMAATLMEARSLADVVLVDTAPLGTVNDAITFVHLMDVAVVVARLNHTTRDAARRLLRTVGNLDVRVAGLVVTDVPDTGQAYYYGAPGDEERAEVPAGR
jgi:succinoglycan biosynthesis transport protein ExoP